MKLYDLDNMQYAFYFLNTLILTFEHYIYINNFD